MCLLIDESQLITVENCRNYYTVVWQNRLKKACIRDKAFNAVMEQC